MATIVKAKKTTATTKKTTTIKSKKSNTLKQIEALEKALENVKDEDVINLVPEEVKADIISDKAKTAEFETPKDIDFNAEVKKIIEDVEPSKEIKEQLTEFEEGKDKFNEKLNKEPEKAEQLLQEELKRVENLKKKAEALKASIQKNKTRLGNEGFTNWWNGASDLF